ncbi:MAG: hypothetical protein PWP15_1105 [Methanothermococcus sp.]|uniref:phage head-tail connector protein n=1 Tax=Methanothermococcus sp. TaxID=2614238 RepID=UPI00258EA809|nr:phage head-tail connector protein [Methanothermococcus sp.]MDK2790598.1 hypothetical protein [Methanothermococcus sp.]
MILDLTTYKLLKGITSTENDTQIEKYLEIVDSQIKQYTNNNFLNDEGTEVIPADLLGIAADMVEDTLNGNNKIKSQSLEGNSISFVDNLENKTLSQLNKYRKMVL